MGKLTTFEIFVDNPEGQVRGGDTLQGQVVLEAIEDLDVIEIRVEFKGTCQVQWTNPKSSTPMAEIHASAVEPLVAEEEYVHDSRKLFPTHAQTDATARLEKGSHTFDFQFHIPANAPSTFCGTQGHVRYTLRATVERTWKSDVNKRDVTVSSCLDLNTVPAAQTAVLESDTLKLSSFLFPSGECAATMKVCKRGFTPGEVIPVDLAIHNRTHHELYKVQLLLRMITQYRAYGDRFSGHAVLTKTRLARIPAGRSFEGCDRSLRVPACPPTRLPGCNLIKVCYQLELKIRPAMLTLKRLRLVSEVIVGTVSLDTTSQADTPPDYWATPPPSYEDVIASEKYRQTSSPLLDRLQISHEPSPVETSPTPATSSTPTPATPPTPPLSPPPNVSVSSPVEPPFPPPPSFETASAAAADRLFLRGGRSRDARALNNDDLRLTVLKTSVTGNDHLLPLYLRPRANTTEGTVDTFRPPGR